MPTPPTRARRTLARAGEPGTLTTYTDTGSRDDYGDPTFTESTTAITALFRQPSDPTEVVETAGGVTTDIDAEVWVDSTHRSLVTAPSESDIRASELTRDRTGDTFVVEDVWDEANGLLRCACVKKSP